MSKILSYRDLDAWKVGMDLAEQTYGLTDSFPIEERYGLTSQMRRASVSISSNIAEGQCRQMIKSYLYFINVALGSSGELDTQLELARRRRLVTMEAAGDLQASLDRVRQILHGMRRERQFKLLGAAGTAGAIFAALFLRFLA